MRPGTKCGGGAEKDKHSAENDKVSAENDKIKGPKKSAETGGHRRRSGYVTNIYKLKNEPQ
jgi:hypothetical protein